MITFLYASILGVMLFLISMEAISARRRNQISLGVGDSKEIEAIVSAHHNFSSYTPMLLILLFGLEYSKVYPSYIIHLFGILITLGRTFHYYAFRGKKMDFKNRVRGMQLTLWSLLILGLLNFATFVKIRFF